MFKTITFQAQHESTYGSLIDGKMCILCQVKKNSQNKKFGCKWSHNNNDIPLPKNVMVYLAVGIRNIMENSTRLFFN